jgi:hypothetical protein
MLASIQQDVDERVPHFLRRPQHPPVIPVGPDAPSAPELPIDHLRQSDAKALHPACERLRSVGLDEKVDVVPLYGEVRDAKPHGRCGGDGTAYEREHPRGAQ